MSILTALCCFVAKSIARYSFCRVADDLVDEATSTTQAEQWIKKLQQYLDISYGDHKITESVPMATFVRKNFPPETQSALLLLPTSYLSPKPLYDLLEGFKMDLAFSSHVNPFPIENEELLEIYGSRVAGTVAELCIELVYHHTCNQVPESERLQIVAAGHRMGIALQYINISRDISVDASNRRVYLPSTWLKELGLSPEHIIRHSVSTQAEHLRQRLLDKATGIYHEARGAIERLPLEARGPMRVAVESYVEIGRVLRCPGYKVKQGRATVSKIRRLRVARRCLLQ